MHINAFFMRSSAFADTARMFGDPFSGASSFPGKGHGASNGVARGHFHGPTGGMRDAMKAVLDLVSFLNPDSMVTATGTWGHAGFDGIKGSQNGDAISYSDAIPTRVVNAYIDAGGGDDTVSFSSLSGGSHEIYGGSGNDAVSASAQRLRIVSGGSGNDAVAVAGEYIGRVSGGSGDDAVAVAGRHISRVDGGSGDDAISVTGDFVGRVSGGAGDDTITVSSGNRRMIESGLYAVGPYGFGRPTVVEGGAGDDTIMVDGEGLVVFRAGDGQDTVTITERTEFAIFGESWGDDTLSLDTASFVFENGALTVSWEGRDERITILTDGEEPALEMTSDRTFVVTPA